MRFAALIKVLLFEISIVSLSKSAPDNLSRILSLILLRQTIPSVKEKYSSISGQLTLVEGDRDKVIARINELVKEKEEEGHLHGLQLVSGDCGESYTNAKIGDDEN